MAAAALSLAALSACQPAPGAGPNGATAAPAPTGPAIAESWFAARADAQRQGTENLVSFYTEDVVLDHRALGPAIATDREAALRTIDRVWEANRITRTVEDPPFLAADGTFTHERLAFGDTGPTDQVVFRTELGPRAAAAETLAMSELGWRRHHPRDRRTMAVDALARSYVAAWSAGDASAVRALYAASATVTDSLLGVAATGPAIAGLAGQPSDSGGIADMGLVTLPDFGGPAVFAAGSTMDREPMDGIGLILATGEGASCPEQVAVWVDLDDGGLIESEERYHRLADLSACHPGADLSSGWWRTVAVPDPVVAIRTGTVEAGGHSVEVYNGSPELQDLLEWGFERLAAAGLRAPSVARVTFYPENVDRCEGISGLIQQDAISLCFDTATACTDVGCTAWRAWTRATVLHELGHAWMAENVDDATIAEFLDRSGMRTWASTKAAWGDRGVELAAETFAWGLMDSHYQVRRRLQARTCQELADLFQILTGQRPDPMPSCDTSAPPASGSAP